MNKEKGATLAVALLMLLVLTLLGVSTIQVTQLQEKMSSNLQDKGFSFLSAESALSHAENWLLNLTTLPSVTSTCQNFPCVQTVYQNFDFTTQTSSWWQANSAAYPTSLNDVLTNPRYVIEFLQFVPDTPVIGTTNTNNAGVYYYRVTARGTGTSDSSATILQTTLARRF